MREFMFSRRQFQLEEELVLLVYEVKAVSFYSCMK